MLRHTRFFALLLSSLLGACTVQAPLHTPAPRVESGAANLPAQESVPPHAQNAGAKPLQPSPSAALPGGSSVQVSAERVLAQGSAVSVGVAPQLQNLRALEPEKVSAPDSQRGEIVAPGSQALVTEDPPVSAPREVSPAAVQPTVASPSLGITGSIKINFASRLDPVQDDVYQVDLACADSVRIAGTIRRSARKFSKFLGREEQPLQFVYDLQLALINPADRTEQKSAGTWSGKLNVSKQGEYAPEQLKLQSILATQAGALSGTFAGKIRGQAEERKGVLGTLREYTRIFGSRKVTLKLQKVDPLRFEALVLAGGPIELFRAATVNGNFDYDYDTGNWLTTGIKFKYADNSQDTISGSVKWIEDANRLTNGKGKYQFNLRFNEDAAKRAQSEETFFENVSDEEAFFALDDTIPTLSGEVSYKDSFEGADSDGAPRVVQSTVLYDLKGTQLSKAQLLAFVKLWLLIVGPVNDE